MFLIYEIDNQKIAGLSMNYVFDVEEVCHILALSLPCILIILLALIEPIKSNLIKPKST